MDIASTIAAWAPLAAAGLVGAAGIAMRIVDNANLQNRPEPYFAAAASAALFSAYAITATRPGGESAWQAAMTATLAVGAIALLGATLKLRIATRRRTSALTAPHRRAERGDNRE